MPLNSSGQLSIGGDVTGQSILKELNKPTTSQASLNDSALRTLAAKPSGTISMSNFYGKADEFYFTINSNLSQQNLRTLAVNAGWNGSSYCIATLASGRYITSNSISVPALTINGSWPNGVKLINQGKILGKGGGTSAVNGQAGGSAVSLGVNCTIHMNGGYIGGGGGAGGATSTQPSYGGGGAGAGKGNVGVGGTGGATQGGRAIPGAGGAGKYTARSGSNSSNSYAAGNGGSAGGGGSSTTYAASHGSHTNQGTFIGNCAYSTYYTRRGDGGGGGGGWGAAGGRGASSALYSGSGTTGTTSGGGGGGTGGGGGATASGAGAVTYSSGGGGGRAVQRNGKTVTWIGGTGNVYGAVS